MTTSHLGIPGLYVKIFEDFCREFPRHTMRVTRFLVDLDKRCRTRGVNRTLCIDLPSLGKVFDKGLSSGRYIVDSSININQRSFSQEKDSGIVPIIELCFNDTGEEWVLKQDLDPTIVFYCRTFLYCAKKLELSAPASVVSACEGDFFTLDSQVQEEPILNWDSCGYTQDELLKLIKWVSRRFIPLQIPEWKDLKPRHGPGAVSDLNKRRKDKFSFPTWSDRLQSYFPYEEFGFHKLNMEDPKPQGDGIARVCSVPKTLNKVRVITVEPASNQFIQQSLRGWLIDKQTAVASICIDVSDQEKSKTAAKHASVDGCDATVDLKSASDFLSLSLFRSIFEENPILCDMLLACRTERVLTPDWEDVSLKKYAGQGNATTFVVQSLIYSILAVTAILVDEKVNPDYVRKNKIWSAAKKVRVFGDDILLPSQNLPTLSLILEHVGLRVNEGKTHSQGHFREACGGDYFQGYDVTPFYLRHFIRDSDPEGLVSWCNVSDNAYNKGLLSTSYSMREGLNLPVNSPSGIGFSSRLNYRFSPKRRRWNSDLQRYEYLELVPSSKIIHRESELTYGRLYKYFVEQPSQLIHWDGRLTVRNRVVLKTTWVD